MISVVATAYLLGLSTRRVDKLVETLGIASLSKSQVSKLAKSLDAAVEQFRNHPLDGGPYRLVQAIREGRRSRYQLNPTLPLRHPLERDHQIGDILAVLTDTTAR